MAANTQLRVTELNFDTIKANLKNFLRNKPEFTDVDFEGSTINYFLDALAYHTYYNAFLTNMQANEMFLDSATLRSSAVSIAKHLKYIPKSARAARAQLSITINQSDNPNEIIIPAGTRFRSTVDGVTYEFVTIQQYSVTNNDGLYQKTIDVYDGHLLSYEFVVGPTDKFFEIPEENVDLTTLKVEVRDSVSTTTKTQYSRADTILKISSTDNVYFIQENGRNLYEVYFGDGILGKAIQPGNVVTISGLICNGTATNNVASFTPVSYVGYNALNPTIQYTGSVSVIQKAFDGENKESIESIKFNAPNLYEIQNRLVTADDYKNFILSQYNDIQAISVWGGEEHDPPFYGKMFVSLKPTYGFTVSASKKNEIISAMDERNVMSIEPYIIDPIFVYVNTTTRVVYDGNRSTLDTESLFNLISNTVQQYELTQLGNFEKSFRYSRFVEAIDDSDPSIISNQTSILLEKRFLPVIGTKLSYETSFSTSLFNPYAGYLGCISSTEFRVSGIPNSLFLDDDGYGKLRLYYLDISNNRQYVDTDVGTVDYNTGKLVLQSFNFTSFEGDEIRIFAQIVDKDYTPIRNEIVLLSYPRIEMFNANTNRIIKAGTIDVTGNYSPIKTSSIVGTVTF